MPYKYGTYGAMVESAVTLSTESGTVPVYFGTAPINLVRGWRDRGLVNQPVRIRSLADATAKVGYCDNFEAYTLCEAIAAHFDAGTTGVGPIYLINVLDPDKHKAKAPITGTLNFANGNALIAGDDVIIDSVKIARQLPADLAALPAQTVEFRGKGTGAGDKGFDYAKAYADAGVKLAGTTLTYEPTGKIDEHLIHDGTLYVGLKLAKPKGATHVTVKINGEVVDDNLDLSKDGEFVLGCELIEYIGVAKADGTPLKDKHLEIECEWTGGESQNTALLAATGEGGYYTPGDDYEIEYNATRGGVQIRDLTGEMPAAPTVTYELVDPTQVTVDDVVGNATANGELSGIEALKLLYLSDGAIANILAAPGWSEHPEVCAALGRACRKINGHWDAFYVVDIPLKNADGEAVDTMAKAVKWKADQKVGGKGDVNALPYNDERSKVCWPMAQDARGRIFHVSTLCVVEMQRTDQDNGGIPMETPANKAVPVVKQHFGEASRNMGFDRRDSDDLVMHGVTTITPWNLGWTLWGDHTAAYEYDVEGLDPRVIFDNSLRMLMHITNSFQRDWEPTIDEPMTRSLIDTITAREQEKLDQLVSIGALIGKPTVAFDTDANTYEAKVNGYFYWSIAVTPTPPLKAATVSVGYTDAGFVTYWGEEA